MPASTIRAGARDHRARALELDDVGAALLDEADRRADGVLVGHLVRAERQVADDERPARVPRDRAGEEEHLVDRDGHGRALVAEDDHRRRVADEDDVDPGVLGEARAGGVVGGDHHDLVAALLHRERARAAAAFRPGRRSCGASFEGDVVDQADGADADGGGEDGRVERGDLDVVDVEAVEQRARLGRVAGGEGAGEGERAPRAPRV